MAPRAPPKQSVTPMNNPTTFTVHRGDEVYVYVRGRLVQKRWLNAGITATFHVNPDGITWSTDDGKPVPPARDTRTSKCKRCGNPCHDWQVYCGGACSVQAEAGR